MARPQNVLGRLQREIVFFNVSICKLLFKGLSLKSKDVFQSNIRSLVSCCLNKLGSLKLFQQPVTARNCVATLSQPQLLTPGPESEWLTESFAKLHCLTGRE